MLTQIVEDFNIINQENYDAEVEEINIYELRCPKCGQRGYFIRYGHYKRPVKVEFNSEPVYLRIQRLLCKKCKSTHAILLSVLVPYQQIPLEDQQEILRCISEHKSPQEVMERNILIDENNVKSIVRNYRKAWEQRILSMGLTLKDHLSEPCLNNHKMQFLQIHRRKNGICTVPTSANPISGLKCAMIST